MAEVISKTLSKYMEIKDNLDYKTYVECVPMTKTMYPKYFTFDKTKSTRWNEEWVKKENNKNYLVNSTKDSTFHKGSDFYNDLVEYVKLYGFNDEQAEFIVGHKTVARIGRLSGKLDFVGRLAVTFKELADKSKPVNQSISETPVTFSELVENSNNGKYNSRFELKRPVDAKIIYNENETIEWNNHQLELATIRNEEHNQLALKEHELLSTLMSNDVLSYLCGLGISKELANNVYRESHHLESVLSEGFVNPSEFVDDSPFGSLKFYVDIMENLISKS